MFPVLPRSQNVSFRPIGSNIDIVPAVPEAADCLLPESWLDPQPIAIEAVWGKETRKVLAAEFRRFYCLIQGHPKDRHVQEKLDLPLVLLITTHASEGNPITTRCSRQ